MSRPTERELHEYYTRKALQLNELQSTYNHPNWYKRSFFRARFGAVFGALDPQPKERVLDVGSGPGYYAQHIAERGASVVAMDLSRPYLTQCPEGVRDRVVAHAQKLPFRSAVFDRVLATEVLEHASDPATLVREVARVLKRGGRAVITTPSSSSYMDRLYLLKTKLLRYTFHEHLWEFRREGFVRLLSPQLRVLELRYANCLLPYPADLFAMKIPESLGSRWFTAMENSLSKGRGGSKFGWTMIAVATPT